MNAPILRTRSEHPAWEIAETNLAGWEIDVFPLWEKPIKAIPASPRVKTMKELRSALRDICLRGFNMAPFGHIEPLKPGQSYGVAWHRDGDKECQWIGVIGLAS